ncbi:hypothetical protein MSC49_03240 [Methylosinus sp. C49]|nr:hypothetical protein MSC49_03240 [Methylosinus sp. C49]
MSVCGADIQSRDLVLVSVDKNEDGTFSIVENACTKIQLAGDDQETVRGFRRALAGFIRSHDVRRISLKGRNTNGKFAGGAVGFKIEALVQSLEECDVMIMMPTTIASQVRRHTLTAPESLYKYQHGAYLTASATLVKSDK